MMVVGGVGGDRGVVVGGWDGKGERNGREVERRQARKRREGGHCGSSWQRRLRVEPMEVCRVGDDDGKAGQDEVDVEGQPARLEVSWGAHAPSSLGSTRNLSPVTVLATTTPTPQRHAPLQCTTPLPRYRTACSHPRTLLLARRSSRSSSSAPASLASLRRRTFKRRASTCSSSKGGIASEEESIGKRVSSWAQGGSIGKRG